MPHAFARCSRALIAIFVAFTLATGCASSPDADEQPQPTQTDDETAQQAPADEAPPPMAPQDEDIDVTDDDIERIADVIVATAEMEEEIEERLRDIETEEEARQLEAEILAEIEGEVEAAGLTLDEYEQIMLAIQQDPDLQQRLHQELEDRGEGDLLRP